MPKANWRDDLDFELGINFAAWFWFFSVVMALWSFVGGVSFRVWWRKLTAEGEDNG